MGGEWMMNSEGMLVNGSFSSICEKFVSTHCRVDANLRYSEAIPRHDEISVGDLWPDGLFSLSMLVCLAVDIPDRIQKGKSCTFYKSKIIPIRRDEHATICLNNS